MLRVRVHVPGLLALLPGGQHAQGLRVRVHVPGLLALLPEGHDAEEQHGLRLVRVHDRLDQHDLRPHDRLEQGGQAEDEQAEGDQDGQADWNGAELLAHPWHEPLQQMVVRAQEIECDYALVLPVLLLGTNYDLYLLQPWDCEHEHGHPSSACEVLVHLF